MSVLIIGGAGYIGAHVVRLLEERGDQVVVADDLSTGSRSRTGSARVVDIDIASGDAHLRLEEVMRTAGVDSVVNLAAKKQVGESQALPAWYYLQNVGGLAQILRAMEASEVRDLVFSSSAAVYGSPDIPLVDEGVIPAPINPYGETKLVGEWMVADAARAWGLRAVSLRYFNVAGAGWPDLGDPATLNLVTKVFARMDERRPPVIYGDDYRTPDGTCIRDYVHVLDLADAHLVALRYLKGRDRPYSTFNVGTGTGSSVREVIDEIAKASGADLRPEIAGRRPGDPAHLVADATRIRELLGWQPEYGLPAIVQSAWEAHVAESRG